MVRLQIAGMYFVSASTFGRIPHFGQIVNGKMVLNAMGRIVLEELIKTTTIRPNYELDAHVVIPDHLHAIFIIRQGESESKWLAELSGFGSPSRTVGSMMRGFKGACCKRIRMTVNPDFAWQRNFHDRVIRNHEELERIRIYIHENPMRWEEKNSR